MTTILQFKALLYLNYAHKNQNNFNAIFVPAQLNERIPPNSRHEGEDLEILKRRHAIYQEAQEQLPFSLVWKN